MINLILFFSLFISHGWVTSQQSAPESQAQMDERVNAQFQKARQAYQAKDYPAAIEQFNALLQDKTAYKFYTQSHYYLGRALYLTQKYSEALASYQQIKPGMFGALYARHEMGRTYLALENIDQAVAAYRWLATEAETTASFSTSSNENFPTTYEVYPEAITTLQRAYRTTSRQLGDSLADLFPSELAVKYEVKQTPYPDAARPDTPKIDASLIVEMGKNGVNRPNILYKEKAKYTDIARVNWVQGTVVLNVVFGKDSTVQNIRVVRGLEDGLTRQAILAATKIRFSPAVKDGEAVNVRGNLEFSFNLF